MTHPPDPIVIFTPGKWQHYKGGIYIATAIVREHDTRRPWVLYYPDDDSVLPRYSIRPLEQVPHSITREDCWTDTVEYEGEWRARFRLLEALT